MGEGGVCRIYEKMEVEKGIYGGRGEAGSRRR